MFGGENMQLAPQRKIGSFRGIDFWLELIEKDAVRFITE
jgi:hypothetical protein